MDKMEQQDHSPIGSILYATVSFIGFIISALTVKDVQAGVSIIAGLVAITAGALSIRKSLKEK